MIKCSEQQSPIPPLFCSSLLFTVLIGQPFHLISSLIGRLSPSDTCFLTVCCVLLRLCLSRSPVCFWYGLVNKTGCIQAREQRALRNPDIYNWRSLEKHFNDSHCRNLSQHTASHTAAVQSLTVVRVAMLTSTQCTACVYHILISELWKELDRCNVTWSAVTWSRRQPYRCVLFSSGKRHHKGAL